MDDIVKYVLGIMGVGKADAMSPRERLEYTRAVEPEKLIENKPEPEIVPTEGQVNLKNNRRREELGEAELVTLLARQKAMADKAKRGGY
jgi:hypothetical protein